MIGTVTFMIVFYALNAVIHFSFLNLTAQEFGIAVIHTTFNIVTTAYLLPLRNVLEKLAYATIKLDDDEKNESWITEAGMNSHYSMTDS